MKGSVKVYRIWNVAKSAYGQSFLNCQKCAGETRNTIGNKLIMETLGDATDGLECEICGCK